MTELNPVDSIRDSIKNRLISPLGGIFTLSWLAWNYKFLVVALSATPINEKLATLDALHSTSVEHTLFWLFYPLGSTFLALLIYPVLSYYTSYWMHQWTNKLRQHQADHSVDLVSHHDFQEFKKRYSNLENKCEILTGEIKKEKSKLEDAKHGHSNDVTRLNEEVQRLQKLTGKLTINERNVITHLSKEDGYTCSTDRLIRGLMIDPKAMEFVLRELHRFAIVRSENNSVTLTDQGFRAAVTQDLYYIDPSEST